jgi:hypothetical protein
MSRGKARKPRDRSARREGRAFLRFADGQEVQLPGFTAEQAQRVKELVAAGQVEAPEVLWFIRAVGRVLGHETDFSVWSSVDTIRVLRLMDLLPDGEWTALDDLELATLLQHGGTS